MTPERAHRLINNLDVPEKKRKFWPQHFEVIVASDGTVPDVFQYFTTPTESEYSSALHQYPGCVSFPATAGETYSDYTKFAEKISSCIDLTKKIRKR